METLAVIAWKVPVLQSDIISIRTNKAYDHLVELEKSGFISRSKSGRTKLIKLTDRFFNYFDVKNAEAMKEKFKVKGPEPQVQTAENSPEANPAENSETGPDAEPEINPGTDSEVNPDTDTEVSPSPDTEQSPETDSEVNPNTEPGTDEETDSQTESGRTENTGT